MTHPRTPQQQLMREIMPLLRAHGTTYRKVLGIQARQARPGEVVTTCTSDGVETEQTAREDHVFVQALTRAQERYLLERRVFDARYENPQTLGEQMAHFQPLGLTLALRIDADLLKTLGPDAQCVIEAPWGTDMVVRVGDMFASPMPNLDEIYRIAAHEFAQTYAPIDAPASG